MEVEISFLLPIYNVASFLEECVLSILGQNLNSNYEIICIDDCSTDGSLKELIRLKDCINDSKLVNFRIISNKKNNGVCYTRNRLLREAVGTYIWFIDPDDMLIPNVGNYMLSHIKQSSCNVILGNYRSIPEALHFNEVNECKKYYEVKHIYINDDKLSYLPTYCMGIKMNAVWAGIFRREFLIANNLFFHEGMIAQEDTLFYYEISLFVDTVLKTDTEVYCYRKRSTSIMNSHSEEKNKKYYESMKIMYSVYKKYLDLKIYKNEANLKAKIHHTRENLALSLALCTDNKFVKDEMKALKKKGVYPYPFRKNALYAKRSKIINFLVFTLPIYPCFLIAHFIFNFVAEIKMKRV